MSLEWQAGLTWPNSHSDECTYHEHAVRGFFFLFVYHIPLSIHFLDEIWTKNFQPVDLTENYSQSFR